MRGAGKLANCVASHVPLCVLPRLCKDHAKTSRHMRPHLTEPGCVEIVKGDLEGAEVWVHDGEEGVLDVDVLEVKIAPLGLAARPAPDFCPHNRGAV